MNASENTEVSRTWIAAIVGLVILLAVGFALLVRMRTPLSAPKKHAAALQQQLAAMNNRFLDIADGYNHAETRQRA